MRTGVRRLMLGMLLLGAAWPSLSRSADPNATQPPDELAKLQDRVKELEAQVASYEQQLSNLREENQTLRLALTKVAVGQPSTQPKGSVPFDFNGLRFYSMPAASAQQAAPPKR